jgi:hypothetical protein
MTRMDPQGGRCSQKEGQCSGATSRYRRVRTVLRPDTTAVVEAGDKQSSLRGRIDLTEDRCTNRSEQLQSAGDAGVTRATKAALSSWVSSSSLASTSTTCAQPTPFNRISTTPPTHTHKQNLPSQRITSPPRLSVYASDGKMAADILRCDDCLRSNRLSPRP